MITLAETASYMKITSASIHRMSCEISFQSHFIEIPLIMLKDHLLALLSIKTQITVLRTIIIFRKDSSKSNKDLFLGNTESFREKIFILR